MKNLSKTITGRRVCGAEIEVPPQARVNGTLIAQGGPFGGWSLYVKDDVPAYDYNFLGLQKSSVAATNPPAGKAIIRFDFACHAFDRRAAGILLSLAGYNHFKRRREMKKNILVVFSAMMLIGGMSCATGTQNKEGAAKPGVVVVDAVKLTGTVKAIDREKKMVTVEGSGGRTVVIDATNARNLDQLKVGDKVNLTYVEELALFVRKSDEPPSVTESQNVELAPKGEKPGGVITKTIEVTGNVESIDTNNRTIALKGPAGNVRTYKVGPEAKRFNEIKRGDQVVLRVTQAVALSVGNP